MATLKPTGLPFKEIRRQWQRGYVSIGPAALAHGPALRVASKCSAWLPAVREPGRQRFVCTAAAATGAAVPEPSADSIPPQSEAVKIGSLGMLFFCSTFIYTILQNLKDSIIVSHVGAEVLPFLEAYGVLPMSFAFFVLYSKLNQILPEKWVYSVALLPFLSFYALFGAVLYPNASALHPTHLIDSMRAALPTGLVGIASMIVYWTYSLFFILGELWGGVAISLLFWGLADEVCTVREAESVYPLLGIIANIGLVLSGAWIKYVNGNAPMLADVGLMPVQALIMTVLAVAGVLILIKTFIHNHFVQSDTTTIKKGVVGKDKPKKTLAESLEILRKSPKINNLAILVISYFVSQKLFDFAWKAELRVLYPAPEDCQRVLASVSQWTGIVTIALMATSKFVFRLGGWVAAAVTTPLAILVTGAMFFASAIAMTGNASFLGPQAVAVLVGVAGFAGAAGRVASRAPKYSLFDPAKEMVYITMSKDEKKEGKAAVDLLGSYFGKSGASWIMQGLVLVMGTLTTAMPIIGVVHFAICVAWVRSTFSLAALMKDAMKEEESKDAARTAAAADAAAGVAMPAVAAAVAAAEQPKPVASLASTNGNNLPSTTPPTTPTSSVQSKGHAASAASSKNGNAVTATKDLLPCCNPDADQEYGYSEAYELCEPGDPCVIHESMWDSSTPISRITQTPGNGPSTERDAVGARPAASGPSRR